MNWKRMDLNELEDCTFYLIHIGDRIVSAQYDAINNWFSYNGDDCETIWRPSDVTHFCEITWPEGGQ